MADRGGDAADPYTAALALARWARVNWNDLDGRLLLAGRQNGADDLTLRQLCNAAYAAITEHMDAKERADLDAQLSARPQVVRARGAGVARAAAQRSRGVPELITALRRLS